MRGIIGVRRSVIHQVTDVRRTVPYLTSNTATALQVNKAILRLVLLPEVPVTRSVTTAINSTTSFVVPFTVT